MIKFVVVGTGRCGTAYTAQVLTRMGIPCGHEWVYSAHPRRYPDVEIVGDSSAQAVPFLPEFTGQVLHQVRDPLRVIGSFLGFGLFRDPRGQGVDGQFMMRHFRFTGDELGDAMRYYVDWNRRCEAVDPSRYLRYQLERLDAGLLARIARFVGEDVSQSQIEAALQAVPRDFNTRYNRRPLSWSDLPDGRARDELRTMALEYGYDVAAEDEKQDRQPEPTTRASEGHPSLFRGPLGALLRAARNRRSA